MNQTNSKLNASVRPGCITIFFFAILTIGAVAGIGWLYIQQPDVESPNSTYSSAISPDELDSIPDLADRDAHILLANALRESLGNEAAHEKLAEPIRRAFERILEVFDDQTQSGRERFDRAALFLTTLPYEMLEQFDPVTADKLRTSAESLCTRLAYEEITEIVARHYRRINSEPLMTLDDLETTLKNLKGEIEPIAPILKKKGDKDGIFSNLKDITDFISERKKDSYSAKAYHPGGQRTSTVPVVNITNGAYVLRLRISGEIGRTEDQPDELTFLLDGDRLVGKSPVPSENTSLKLPINETPILTVAETGEEIDLSNGNGNLAPLGMPGVFAVTTFHLPDLNQAQVKLEVQRTYDLPQFLFDAVAEVGNGSAPVRNPIIDAK